MEARVRACRTIARFNPESADARLDLAWSLLEAQRASEALPEFLAAGAVMPPRPMAQYGAGIALASMGRHDEALEQFKAAARLDPRLAAAYEASARSLGALAHHDEALEEARKAVAVAPNRAEAHFAMGVALVQLGQNHEAVQSFVEASRFGRDDWAVQFDVGAALQRVGEADEAFLSFAKAARLRPQCAECWGALGVIAAQASRHRDAVAFWERARILDTEYFATRTDEAALWKRSIAIGGAQPAADTSSLPRK